MSWTHYRIILQESDTEARAWYENEAANEMKSRIRDAIIKNNMNNQLGLLDSSYITTFDSYALSIVKKYL